MGHLLLWLLLIAPWFLLIPLDSRRVKRFLAVAFFTTIIDTIYFQVAQVLNWWTITDNVFFLTHVSAFTYGFLPVATILVFYYTYPNLLLFSGVNIALQALQAFIVSPMIFEQLGLYRMHMSSFAFFTLLLSHIPIIYIFQKWYENAYIEDTETESPDRIPNWLRFKQK
ncbi:hypothetical protein N752_13060 [Desulforamulus aquiferis]|nr:hypothetical protein [Desulforamulus aquiferis]RYD04850.1 hypothetical protein N752_13060 [Desulforamulus aquiferis]